ncbi:hypothetical protein E2C01_076425 [Portunus trituberculatus]|uniref:Uncharacterized protein n=1 Tax=Portunus trituberculatus TaxID=210409 RepID=A0A5B7I8P6_PORTR|nr:hypothetical protein [Portunus trituberculatus]
MPMMTSTSSFPPPPPSPPPPPPPLPDSLSRHRQDGMGRNWLREAISEGRAGQAARHATQHHSTPARPRQTRG